MRLLCVWPSDSGNLVSGMCDRSGPRFSTPASALQTPTAYDVDRAVKSVSSFSRDTRQFYATGFLSKQLRLPPLVPLQGADIVYDVPR